MGHAILKTAPWMMKGLSIAGTAAMFLVGGGILTHGIPWLHHWIEAQVHGLGGVLGTLAPMLIDGVFGIAAGALVLAGVSLVKKVMAAGKSSAAAPR